MSGGLIATGRKSKCASPSWTPCWDSATISDGGWCSWSSTRHRPPRTYGQLDRFVVLAQMSRLPEEEVKSLLDPAQSPEMRRRLLTAKRMLPMLKQNGVILDEGEEPAKEAEAGFAPKWEFVIPKK